jgi:hypothetical protein
MNALFLDAAVQLVQMALLLGLIGVVLDIRARVKSIEAKLGGKT